MTPVDMSGMSGSPSFKGGAGGASGDIYTTTTTNNSSGFNSSGWTVGSGSAKVSASAGGMNPWLIAGLAAVGLASVWMFTRK